MGTSQSARGFDRWESQRSHGITLLEVVILIVVLLMLAALFLPTVRSGGGGGGRRAACLNNMHNLVLALQADEHSRGHFPGYANNVQGKRASWAVMILPYIERNDLWREWQKATSAPTTFIELYVCPSDPAYAPGGNPLSYVINCGNAQKESTANGVCHNLFQNGAASLIDPVRVSLDFIANHDGITNTLLLSENLQAENWGEPFASDDEVKRWTGFVWFDKPASPANQMNGEKGKAPRPTTDLNYSRPSSAHAEGFNAAFCDSRVKFILDNIDYRVYKQLMTPDGAASDDSDKIPLKDDSY